VLKILYAVFPCLSQLISAQFALEMRQKSIKAPILAFKVIQGDDSALIENECATYY